MQKCSDESAHHLWEPGRKGEIERWEICVNPLSSKFEKERVGLLRKVPYLVASLSLSNKNEGIGAYNGKAEVDKDNGALWADVPRVWERWKEKRVSLAMRGQKEGKNTEHGIKY